ncbi:hypothetical protein C8J57DRAFT_1105182, partial [Mycena rebaudengoi]
LHRAVALEAMHNSADSYPQPRCHPETRTEMLAKLFDWYSSMPQRILWLHGPAGAGKSAILRTICMRLDESHQLGGAFFFKRGHATRGNAQKLFATLAYQLALNVPVLKSSVARIVEDTPSVVGTSMDVQMRTLILDAFQNSELSVPPVVVIDGLDECDGQDDQREILRLLADKELPFRVLLASRPEAHISEMFDEQISRDVYHSYNVEQSFHDVHKYFRDEFHRIHREHRVTMAKVPQPWPSQQTLNHLVKKSSGYFIYATTVIKFVDDKNFRPTEQLESLLDDSLSESPFGALDQLYTHILSTCPAQERLIRILRALDFFDFRRFNAAQIERLLELKPGDFRLATRTLHSVLSIPTHKDWAIGLHHASFQDFLHDPNRAGVFFVRDDEQQVDISRCMLKALSDIYEDLAINEAAW